MSKEWVTLGDMLLSLMFFCLILFLSSIWTVWMELRRVENMPLQKSSFCLCSLFAFSSCSICSLYMPSSCLLAFLGSLNSSSLTWIGVSCFYPPTFTSLLFFATFITCRLSLVSFW